MRTLRELVLSICTNGASVNAPQDYLDRVPKTIVSPSESYFVQHILFVAGAIHIGI